MFLENGVYRGLILILVFFREIASGNHGELLLLVFEDGKLLYSFMFHYYSSYFVLYALLGAPDAANRIS